MVTVFAHSGRGDLPFPTWLLVYGAACCFVVTALALRVAWPRPRLAGGARTRVTRGRRLALPRGVPIVLRPLTRAIGLALFAGVVVAALWGDPSPAVNIAPLTVYIVFWSGTILACALVGNIWTAVNPFATLALVARRHRVRDVDLPRAVSYWTAPLLLFSFVWMELAFHDAASPRALGAWLVGYTITVMIGVAFWGRRWVANGEGFTALFGAIATRGVGARRLSAPITMVLLVAIGGSAFDGVTGTGWWLDIVEGRRGWNLTAVNTIGLVWSIAVVGLVFYATVRGARALTGLDASELGATLTPSLVPLAVGATIAHYFDLLVIESQNFVALASDPLGRGWDLFGTIGNSPEIIPSPTVTAVVQGVTLIAAGVIALVVVHDRALADYRPAQANRIDRCMLVFVAVLMLSALALLVES